MLEWSQGMETKLAKKLVTGPAPQFLNPLTMSALSSVEARTPATTNVIKTVAKSIFPRLNDHLKNDNEKLSIYLGCLHHCFLSPCPFWGGASLSRSFSRVLGNFREKRSFSLQFSMVHFYNVCQCPTLGEPVLHSKVCSKPKLQKRII